MQQLRSSTVITNDLARAIRSLNEELVSGQEGPRSELALTVQGKTRDLAPLVRDDVHRVAGEAIRNAFRHAQAERIEVAIHYEERQFRLQVRDNGRGMGQEVWDGQGCAGHFGVPGMRERAKLVGGTLVVWSKPGAGTEIQLTIPASLAYLKVSKAKESGYPS